MQERHAQAFHDGQPIDEILGLHWHLGFPEDVTGEQWPVQDEATSELALFACASAALSLASAETQAMLFTLPACTEDFISKVVIRNDAPQLAVC